METYYVSYLNVLMVSYIFTFAKKTQFVMNCCDLTLPLLMYTIIYVR